MQRKQNSQSFVFRFLIIGAGLALFLAAHSSAFVFSLQTVEQRTFFYVSDNGNDAWDGQAPTYEGESTGPWQTLQRADNTVFQPGDILFLNRGDIFQGPIILQGSGNSGNPCTVMPYGEGVRPIIESPNSYGISFYDDAWEIQGLEIRDCLTGIALQWREKTDWEYFRFTDLYMHDIVQNSAIHWMTSGNTNLTQSVFRDIEISNSRFEQNRKAWGTYVTTNDASHYTFNDLRFTGCTFVSNGYGVVSLQFVTTGLVDNCYFENNGSSNHVSASLMLQYAHSCTVRDTIIKGTKRHGTLHDGQGLNFEGDCQDCTVDNVHISDCDGAAILFFNKDGKSHQNLEIKNCTFYNNCLNPYPEQGYNDLIFYGNSTGEIHHNNSYHREEVNFTGGPGSTNGFYFHDNNAYAISAPTDSTVLYQDTFSGLVAPLEGRTMEAGGSVGETWITKEGFETDGLVAAISTHASRVAALPFAPMAGERYRLSADITIAGEGWGAFGFISDDVTVNGREFFFNLIDNPSPWMNITSLGIVNTFGGPSTADKIAFPDLGTNGTLMIELDTRGHNWIATYFIDGTALRTNTFAGALSSINYVGFGNFSPADMTVDNFKLEIVAQSAEVSLTHNDYVPIYDFTQPSSDVDFFHRYLDEFDIHAHRMREDSDTALQNIATLQNTHGYRISCTSSDLRYQSTNEMQSGEICAQTVLDSVARFYSFSGTVTRLYIDHPWQLRWQVNPTNDRLVVSTGMTMQESAGEIVDFIQTIHDTYPDWEIFLLPNFINYGWKGERAYRSSSGEALGVGDFYEEFTLVYSNALATGLPLNGILIDFPYPAAMGNAIPLADVYNGDPDEFDWMARFRDLENDVESRGLQFGIINNSNAGPVNQGYQFYVDSLDYIDVYTGAPYYGSPALWAPRTWYANKPPEQVPEVCLINGGTANYTMSAIVNATIDRVKRPEVDGSLQAFNENGNEQGWVVQSSIANTEVTNGYYRAATTASDASIIKIGLSIDGIANPIMEIAMAVDAASTALFYYQVNGDTAWYGPAELSIIPDAEIHVYKLDMSTDPTWMDGEPISALRLEPSATSGTEFAIDYIWIHPDF